MTAADVFDALRNHFPAEEFALLPQATQGVGYRGTNRYLDALLVQLWPSRGLYLHGIEIKVSGQDYRRELKDPAKADALVEHLDYFSIAAPAGVVKVESLPKAWGLIEIDPMFGFSPAPKVPVVERVKPKKLHAGRFDRPLPRSFFAALCRRLNQETIGAAVARADGEAFERGRKAAEFEIRVRLGANDRERLVAAAFMKHAGLSWRTEEEAARIGRVVSAIAELEDPASKWGLVGKLRDTSKRLNAVAKTIAAVLSEPTTEHPSSETNDHADRDGDIREPSAGATPAGPVATEAT